MNLASTPGDDRRCAPDWRDPAAEPRLDDILSDPVVRLLMRRDGLDPADVRRMMVAKAADLRLEAALRVR
jgi:hypothetical protein